MYLSIEGKPARALMEFLDVNLILSGRTNSRRVMKLAAKSGRICINEISFRKESADNGGDTRISIYWVLSHRTFVEHLNHLRERDWISRVPGMQQVCAKVLLADVLQNALLSWLPRTWSVPRHSAQQLAQHAFGEAGAVLIIKPNNGSQGKNIRLSRNEEELFSALEWLPKASDGQQRGVVQKYVDNPLLLGGHKWDMRLYALVLPSVSGSMHCFLAQEGLVRVCPHPYQAAANVKNLDMTGHLTNYSINKCHEDYDHDCQPGDAFRGSKRTLRAVLERLRDEGRLNIFEEPVWKTLTKLVRQVVVAMHESLRNSAYEGTLFDKAMDPHKGSCFDHPLFHQSFHLLGFDVLLDDSGNCWLLEVNSEPSLDIREDLVLDKNVSIDDLRFLSKQTQNDFQWGKPCSCTASSHLHSHRFGAVDVAIKLPVVNGIIDILHRCRLQVEPVRWTDGTIWSSI